MNKVACTYCGLPFRAVRAEPGKTYFCCSGCALASRVPVDAQGHFPVNATLVAALATGFVLFNQGLFALLAGLLAREGRAETAAHLDLVSMLLAAIGWSALVTGQWRAGARGAIEGLVTFATFGVLVAGFYTQTLGCLLAGNAALALWSVRGFFKKHRG
jgi:hypothetical protein